MLGDAVARGSAVLVHGLWGHPDDWVWVRARLEREGVQVLTPDLPSHRSATAGLDADAAAVRAVVRTAPAPVILVGWSYGGTVISVAGAGEQSVTGLVYVSSIPRPAEPPGPAPTWMDEEDHLVVNADGTFVLDDRWPDDEPDLILSAELRDHLRRYPRRPVSRQTFADGQSGAAWQSIPTAVIVGQDDSIPDRDRDWVDTHEVQWIDCDHFVIFRCPDVVSIAVLDALAV